MDSAQGAKFLAIACRRRMTADAIERFGRKSLRRLTNSRYAAMTTFHAMDAAAMRSTTIHSMSRTLLSSRFANPRGRMRRIACQARRIASTQLRTVFIRLHGRASVSFD